MAPVETSQVLWVSHRRGDRRVAPVETSQVLWVSHRRGDRCVAPVETSQVLWVAHRRGDRRVASVETSQVLWVAHRRGDRRVAPVETCLLCCPQPCTPFMTDHSCRDYPPRPAFRLLTMSLPLFDLRSRNCGC